MTFPRERVGSGVVQIVAAALWLAGGCGSAATAPSGQGLGQKDGSFTTCEDQTIARPYEPGMSVASLAGRFTVKLLKSTPGPPVKGLNSWQTEIGDATSGDGLDGLAVVVTPFMPEHQHGTRPVEVSAAGAGLYNLMPLYLHMSGVWEVRMEITGPSGSDIAIVPICIP